MKKLTLISIVASALLAGCASNTPAPETAKAEAKPAKTAAATSEIPVAYKNSEGKLLCPVMNTVIESEKDAVDFADYNGKRYFFCCGGCPQKFRADPAKYASK